MPPQRRGPGRPRNSANGIVSESPPDPAGPDQGQTEDEMHAIELAEDEAPREIGGTEITVNEDGSSTVDFNAGPGGDTDEDPLDQDANLANFLTDSDLNEISAQILADIKDDEQSRTEWIATNTKGMELLGLKYEERTYPFKGASGVWDPLILKAVIRFQASARGEFLPNSGPVKTVTIGEQNEELSERAKRVQDWYNLYLTKLAPEYYPDRDQMFFWLAGWGSMFVKVYQDPILGRPVFPFITPDNLIVNWTATHLQTAGRITHKTLMDKRDVMLHQLGGEWRNVELGEPQEDQTSPKDVTNAVDRIQGTNPNVPQRDKRHTILESHVDWDIEALAGQYRTEDEQEPGLPLPYRITFDQESLKVLAIKRNWAAQDPRHDKKRFFVHHKFMPGFGFYGLGYFAILGSDARSLTGIRRLMIDAGTLATFPGGLRVKGMKIDDNQMTIGPTEFREIDTGGQPIQNAIMPLPYKGADPQLMQLRKEISEDSRDLAGTAEIAVGEGRQDAPVGTTVALLEAAMRPQSGVFKRLHKSTEEEFALGSRLFGEHLPEEPYPFPVPGGMSEIMRADFQDNIDVIPVSDPNITSSTQRIMRAESILRMAQANPEAHGPQGMMEAQRRIYEEMGVENIDRLLPKPPPPTPPSDPASENLQAMKGMQLSVGPEQDDAAHIAVHGQAQLPEPPAQQAMAVHIAEHVANMVRKQVFQMAGLPFIPVGQPLPPQIENMIAELSAHMAQQQQQAQQQAAAAGAGNPASVQLMIASMTMKEKQAEMAARLEETHTKAAVETYKANLDHANKIGGMQIKLDIARMRSTAMIASKNIPGVGQPIGGIGGLG